jgi:hypothetical protein
MEWFEGKKKFMCFFSLPSWWKKRTYNLSSVGYGVY